MDQTLNHLKVLITAAAIVGGVIKISWIWKKRSSSSNKSAGVNRDLSSTQKPSCTSPQGHDYEVFLSFRGEDNRKEFTDHLYNRLKDAGVRVFRDDEGLQVGEELRPELMKAIKASKISIPIISRNYASSEWCMRELVQILECKKTGQKVLPIFYKVTPSDVRNQTGDFKKAFLLQQKKYGSNHVREWRNALKEVASLKGFESNEIANGHEGELVKILLTKVLKKLKKANLVVSDNLIGVQDHVEKITKMVDTKASNKVQAILIHGMGGIGKTTLSKFIYNQLYTRYEHSSFLPNVCERSSDERGRVDLQKQLISDILGETWVERVTCIDAGINVIGERFKGKKVLILLDDVNHRHQLDFLARESNWFAPGSIVIVTSRNTDILKMWENKLTYELNELDPQQSFQLFCMHAFGRGASCQRELKPIAKKIVFITRGLPLAIEIIGSLLYAKSKDCWEDTLKILKETPNHEVMEKLRISYNSLKYEEQQIFLDIACFSLEARNEFAYYMWDACGFYPRERVKNLISLSLIKIGDRDELIMHDQLKDLGRAIVREKNFNDLEKRSRLWNQEEAWELINEKQGTEEVEALSLVRHKKFGQDYLTSEHFKDLTKLRLLFLKSANLAGDFNHVLTNLKWFKWNGYHTVGPKTMPTNFYPRKLVILELEYIHMIKENWSLWGQTEVVKKLKVLRLEHCGGLNTTPDFSAFKELEILIFHYCSRLTKIHPSIHNVSRTLITLDVSNCDKLRKLPKEVGEMKKLKKLDVSWTSIGEIPISEGSMGELEILSAAGCFWLSRLPDSIGSLVNLHTLSLPQCCRLLKIPTSIGKLRALSKLDLSYTGIVELPESIGDLHNLEVLDINFTCIRKLTPAIGKLRRLQKLYARKILSLKKLPEIGELTSLQHLQLWGSRISCLPDPPCGLTSLTFSGDWMETLPSFSNLTNLEALHYGDLYWKGNKALNIGNLIKLETLEIDNQYNACAKKGIAGSLHLELPSSLVILKISGCPALFTLPSLSNLECLTHLTLYSCPELRNINGLEGAKNIKELSITYCSKLVEIQWLDGMKFIEELKIGHCSSLERIGDLSHLRMLRVLELEGVKLNVIKGIDQLTAIEELKLWCLPCLKTIGDLSHLKKLKKLDFFMCEMLCGVECIGQLTSLKKIDIRCCPCIESVDELSI